MEIQEEFSSTQYTIKSYSPGSIKVNDKTYTSSLILTADALIHPWAVSSVDTLADPATIQPIIELKPDLVILGTGNRFHLLDNTGIQTLKQHGIAIECMDTAAACRTFTALSAEDRNVAAALIIEPEE